MDGYQRYVPDARKEEHQYKMPLGQRHRRDEDKQPENADGASTGGKKKDPIDAYDMISLFKLQTLDACGEAYYKCGVIQRAKRHYVELRGSTLVMFRNASIASSTALNIRDIIGVLVVKHFQIDVEKRQGHGPRIYIKGLGLDASQYLYIKILNEREKLIWVDALAKARSIPLPALRSLTIDSIIGQGGGGKVFLAHVGESEETIALKVIDKRHTFTSSTAFRHVVSERSLMPIVGQHPFVLRMRFAFQSDKNLFIGTPFCGGGDLATYLKNQRKRHGTISPEPEEEYEALAPPDLKKRKRYGGHLSEDRARIILAEIVLALEHLHSRGIVYRDLKPENVLIADDGHLRLADFGLSKRLTPGRFGHGFERTSSVCGTRNYLPPEMLTGRPYGCEADMWSLGIMTFRILCGRFPFEAEKTRDVFQKVRRETVRIPSHVSSGGASLLEGLLCRNQTKRLTAEGAKENIFFKDIHWTDVFLKRHGPAIHDLDFGASTSEALDNFEISKLHGISIGEFVPSDPSGMCDSIGLQQRLDPNGRIVGFEYAAVDDDAPEPQPLTEREVPRLLTSLRRLSSGVSGASGASEDSSATRRRSDLGEFVRAALTPMSSLSASRSSRDNTDQVPNPLSPAASSDR